MGSEWLETILGDVLELKRGYDLPKRLRKPGAVPVISSAGKSDDHEAAKVSGPGVITGRYGTIGEVYYSEQDFWPLNTTLYVRDFKGNDTKFIYYFLQTINYLEYSDKAAVPGVNRNHLHQAEVRLPKSIGEQKTIAHILGTLDDKIELNRRMNETLESMARALFKSWFVDFDPVIDNALAAGSSIPEPLAARASAREALGDQRKPLPENIRSLFPATFAFDEEMGWIPEGWGSSSIADLVESISDTYPLKTVDEVVFLNTGDVLDGNFLHSKRSSTEGLPGQAKKSIQLGDILYSEIRPRNKRHALVDFEASDYVVSTKLMVLRSKGRFDSLFAYFLLTQESTTSHLQMLAESRSGTFPQITYTQLETVRFTLPSCEELVNHFISNSLDPTFRQSRAKDRENETLTKLRDTLLPKLLSGELRIPDAEKLVADRA